MKQGGQTLTQSAGEVAKVAIMAAPAPDHQYWIISLANSLSCHDKRSGEGSLGESGKEGTREGN
jgi:hypothetical protein